MPREATGELRTLADGYAARITIEGRTRKDFVLTTCATEAEAEERCKALAQMAALLRRAGHTGEIEQLMAMGAKARAGRPWEAVSAAVEALCAGQVRDRKSADVPTLVEWARQWTSGELAKKHKDHVRHRKSAADDAQRFRDYIAPHAEDMRVDEFTLEHAEIVMANLPDDMARTTRGHVAQIIGRLMKLAVYPGRLRKDNPIPSGWIPRPSDAKAMECLYPSEDATLLAGKSVEEGKPGPPVLRRLIYGFLDREAMRVDEMANMQWRDFDLDRGHVWLDENKTDDPRDWDLRADVVDALKRWKGMQTVAEPTTRVFADDGVSPNFEHLAEQLRTDLWRVGVRRHQLHERSKVRQPLRAHDLRATFVTISLATGKTETWVSDRTGHRSHTMITRYRRKARTWNLGELGPLCDIIPELTQRVESPTIAPRTESERENAVSSAGSRTRASEAETTNDLEKGSNSDPSQPEIARVDHGAGQTRGNDERQESSLPGQLESRGAELERQLANVCRALADAETTEQTGNLVAEKRDLRREIETLRRDEAGNVRSIDDARRKR